jgi:hypothetical protein
MDNILVSCISATTKIKTSKYNITFTEDNLYKLCNDINKSNWIPIATEFDDSKIIGRVIYGEIVNKKLKIIAKVPSSTLSAYIVPGFYVLDAKVDSKDIVQYTDIELITMGLTTEPIDKDVTKFQELKW